MNESVYVKSHSMKRIDDPNDPRGPFQDSELFCSHCSLQNMGEASSQRHMKQI